MTRSEEEYELKHETQRLNILDSARKIFALKGWSTTMAEIANAAGISQGLAYRYFPSKEAMFNELIDKLMQSSFATLQHIQEMDGTPEEQLTFWISRILNIKREGIGFYQLSFLNQNGNIPDTKRGQVLDQGKAYFNAIKQIIIEGQNTGEFAKGDPIQMVIAITSCIDGISRFALRSPEMLKKHFPDTQIILRMIKP